MSIDVRVHIDLCRYIARVHVYMYIPVYIYTQAANWCAAQHGLIY